MRGKAEGRFVTLKNTLLLCMIKSGRDRMGRMKMLCLNFYQIGRSIYARTRYRELHKNASRLYLRLGFTNQPLPHCAIVSLDIGILLETSASQIVASVGDTGSDYFCNFKKCLETVQARHFTCDAPDGVCKTVSGWRTSCREALHRSPSQVLSSAKLPNFRALGSDEGAIYWYKMAAKQGNKAGHEALGRLTNG